MEHQATANAALALLGRGRYPAWMSNVTEILAQFDRADPAAAEALLPLVYAELRSLAAARLQREPSGQTLQPTALVHEAFVRLVDVPSPQTWESRGHFFSAAAEAMRRILVDNARRKASLKRGGEFEKQPLGESQIAESADDVDVLELSEALDRLAETDRVAVELVKLRYFAGLSMDDAAGALGMSPRKAYYTWAYARSWLHKELGDE